MHYSIAVVLEARDLYLLEEVLDKFDETKESYSYMEEEEFKIKFKAACLRCKEQYLAHIEKLKTMTEKDYTENINYNKKCIKDVENAYELTDIDDMISFAQDEWLDIDFNLYVEGKVDKKIKLRTPNPEGMWDWWVIGGRWRGQVLPVDLTTVDKNTLTYGEFSSFDTVNPKAKKRSYPDGCYVKDLSESAVKELILSRVKELEELDSKYFFRNTKEEVIQDTIERANITSLKDHLKYNVAGYVTLERDWVDEQGLEEKSLYDYLMENKDSYVLIVDIHS